MNNNKMQLVNIDKRDKLDNFIAGLMSSRFLQSWEWGELQEAMGNKIIRVGVEKDGKLLAAAILIKKTLPMGKSYFYCPQGAIINADCGLRIAEFLFNEIVKIAKREKVIFLRFEPEDKLKIKDYASLADRQGLRIIKTIDVQPSKTLVLHLEKSEEELLKSMHQKTRYNIRLARKKGVKIIPVETHGDASEAADDKNFEKFWDLINDTKKRDEFRIHGKSYYKKMLKIDFIKLFLAEYKGQAIAAGIFSFFGDTATYLHGASSNQYRNVMAPFLLQWRVIKQAKKSGYKYYDFYGIDEEKWPGVTRFKKGFKGKELNHPGTFDLVFNEKWYNVYKIVRKIRRNF